jgi:hypothetical protein
LVLSLAISTLQFGKQVVLAAGLAGTGLCLQLCLLAHPAISQTGAVFASALLATTTVSTYNSSTQMPAMTERSCLANSPQLRSPIPCEHWLVLGDRTATGEVFLPLKVGFRQSGGFAGLTSGCELDTTAMSADEAAQLRSLVEQSDILNTQSQRTPNAADLSVYEFSIETRTGSHRVSFDEQSLPARIRPLLERMQMCAKPATAS